jgi:hypothetical protein
VPEARKWCVPGAGMRGTLVAVPKPTRDELQAALRELMRTLALKGASKGGHARAQSLTPAQRRRSARNAAKARWAKNRRAK